MILLRSIQNQCIGVLKIMRSLAKIGTLAAMGILTVGAALASPVSIQLTSGSASYSGSAVPGSDTAGFGSSNFNGWNISYAFGTSGSPVADGSTATGGLDLGTLSATCVVGTGTCSALTITVSSDGFTTPAANFSVGLSNNQVYGNGMVSQQAFVNQNLIDTLSVDGSQTKTWIGGGVPSSYPYSLQLVDVLTPTCAPDVTTCNDKFSVDASISSVPEPGSLALFGAGLLGFALLMRRRARQG